MKGLLIQATEDHNRIEKMLTSQGKKGRVFHYINGNKILLKTHKESGIKYHVTPFKNGESRYQGKVISKEEFMGLNEDEGWTYLGEINQTQIYSSYGHKKVRGISVDPQSEYRAIEEKWEKERGSILGIIVVVFFILTSNNNGGVDTTLLFSDFGLVINGLMLLCLIYYLIGYTRKPYILFRNKKRVERNEKLIYPGGYLMWGINKIFKGYILFGFFVITINLGKVFLGVRLYGRIFLIGIILLIVLTMYVIKKYGDRMKMSFKIIGTIFVSITFSFALIFTASQLVIDSAGEFYRIDEPTDDMAYYLELSDYAIAGEIDYVHISKKHSMLLNKCYKYIQSNRDGQRVATEYISTRWGFLAEIYVHEFLQDSEEVEKHEGFYTFKSWRGDGVIIRRDEEIFIVEMDFEYNGDEMEVIKEMIGGVEDEKIEVSFGGRR